MAGRVGWMAAVAVAAVLTGCGGGGKPATGTFTDSRDGTVYKTVEIGGKRWFAENLNYDAGGSVCYENSANSCAKYGRLYTLETARTACPAEWRLPTIDDWGMLLANVGGETKIGTKLKSATGWSIEGNREGRVPAGTDEYGFSALPGGGGLNDGRFSSVGQFGYWWSGSVTESDTDFVWVLQMFHLNEDVRILSQKYKKDPALYSVRCVAD